MNTESEERSQNGPAVEEAADSAPARVEVGRDHLDMSPALMTVRITCLFLVISMAAGAWVTFMAVRWGAWDWLFREHPLLALVGILGVFIGVRLMARIHGLALVGLLVSAVAMTLVMSLLLLLSDRMTGGVDLTLQTLGLIVIVMGGLLLWSTLVRWQFPLWTGVGLWVASLAVVGVFITVVWSIPTGWFHMLFLFGVSGGVTGFALIEMWVLRRRCERMSAMQAALQVYLDVIGGILVGLKWLVWREGKGSGSKS